MEFQRNSRKRSGGTNLLLTQQLPCVAQFGGGHRRVIGRGLAGRSSPVARWDDPGFEQTPCGVDQEHNVLGGNDERSCVILHRVPCLRLHAERAVSADGAARACRCRSRGGCAASRQQKAARNGGYTQTDTSMLQCHSHRRYTAGACLRGVRAPPEVSCLRVAVVYPHRDRLSIRRHGSFAGFFASGSRPHSVEHALLIRHRQRVK